jgi:hypothetical protein
VVQGTNVTFTGSASDAEDGALTSKLVWRSNLDDQIGTGGSFSTSTLTVGAHTITASATDAGGLTGSATIAVTVTAAAANQAPVVNAGANQTITLPATANLNGTATDDGLPNPPATLTKSWSKVSGPGTVTFGNASSPATTATFSAAGSYVLRLTGNDGALSSTSDVTITVNGAGQTTTLTFAPTADSYVASTTPTANFGAGTDLQVKTAAGSVKKAFLMFTITGAAGKTVTNAKLRLYVTDSSVSGGGIFPTASTWTETGLTSNNQPPPSGSALSTLGAVTSGGTVEFAVTPAVAGDGTLSFVITSPNSDAVAYASKESAHPPQLVVTLQ